MLQETVDLSDRVWTITDSHVDACQRAASVWDAGQLIAGCQCQREPTRAFMHGGRPLPQTRRIQNVGIGAS